MESSMLMNGWNFFDEDFTTQVFGKDDDIAHNYLSPTHDVINYPARDNNYYSNFSAMSTHPHHQPSSNSGNHKNPPCQINVPPQAQGIMESSMLMNGWNFFDEDFTTQVLGKDDDYLSPSHDVINYPAMDNNNYYSNFSAMTTQAQPYQPSFNPGNSCQSNVPPQAQVMEDVIVPPEEMPAKKKRIRSPWQTYGHIAAERKRREQLSQLFVALSATVPGLKKMDKSSILEEAIKHVKILQEKIVTLEEKMEKKAMESVVIVKKSQIVVNEKGSFENNRSFELHSLPEVEVRICYDQILVKVHCEQHKDALANLICKIESLDMSIVSTNATPFGDVALDITIVAEMEKECNVSVKEVATALRAALIQPASASTQVIV